MPSVRRPAATHDAYVLHRHDWSESSLILELFVRDQGRVAVAAKGAKRPYSQLRSVLLPFQRIQVVLGRLPADEGSAEIQNLRGAERAGGPPMPAGAALFSGFYLNELLMKLIARGDPSPRLFDAYALTLATLTQPGDAAVEAALRAFELCLLRETGVLPELDLLTQTQQPVQEDARYSLDAEAGVVPSAAPGTGSLSGATLLALEAALAQDSLPALQQACLAARPELKVALRGLLHYHLGAPLRTRQAMRELHLLER